MLNELRRFFNPTSAKETQRVLPDWLIKDLELASPIIIEELSRDCKVRRLVLYGSYQRGEQRPDSDVDLGILVEQNRVWSRVFEGYDHCFPTDQDKYNARREKELKDRFAGVVSQLDKLSLIFLTPQDLEKASFLTAHSSRGNVARAVLNGRTIFTDSANGWWHKGKGLKI